MHIVDGMYSFGGDVVRSKLKNQRCSGVDNIIKCIVS